MIGVVRDNNDPMQMGRLRVFIPGYDAPYLKNSELPWCTMMSPLMGVVKDMSVGRDDDKISGTRAYGMWNIPKIGTPVVVATINNDESMRVWIGCLGTTYNNTTMPHGKNKGNGKNSIKQATEENKKISTSDMYGLNGDKARGPYERNIAQSDINQNEGNSSDGYHTNTDDSANLDPQVYCWTTPGGHFITMSDSNDHCRVRVKTINGQQIILDDTSERIYISTGKGKTWIEMDEDGHIQIYGESKISISSDKDLCFRAKDNIHMKAGGNIYLETDASGKSASKFGPGNIILQAQNKITARSLNSTIDMSAKAGFTSISSDGGMKVTTKSSINIKSSESILNDAQGSLHFKAGGSIYHLASGASYVKSSRHTISAKICHDGTVNSGPIYCPSVTQGSPDDSAQNAQTAASASELWKTDLKEQMIIPTAEPFTRPAHNTGRNKNWSKLNENVGSGSDESDVTSAVHRGKEY
jgi:hypothetical protein